MELLRPYWHHLSSCRGQLLQLQLLIILRPFLGGAGFMLVVPAIGFVFEPVETNNEQLRTLLSLLPEISSLAVVLALMFALMTLGAAIGYRQAMLAEQIQLKLSTGIRKDLYKAMMNAELVHVTRAHQADYTRIVSDEVDSIGYALDQLIQLTSLVFVTMVYTSMCLYISPSITMIAVLLGILMVVATIPLQGLMTHAGERHLQASENMYRLAAMQVKGARHIKSSNTSQRHAADFDTAVEALASQELNYTRWTAATQLVYSVVSALVFSVLAFVTVELFSADLPVIVLLALVFSRLMPQVNQARNILQRLAYLEPSIRDVSTTLEQLHAHREPEHQHVSFDVQAGISFDKVSYTYPDNQIPALDSFTAELCVGQLVAVTGSSGIGKSTFADMLAGLILPREGSFQVGNTNIDSTTQQAWRRHVTYVPQATFLIEATLRDNLNLLQNSPAPDCEILAALKAVAGDFVNSLPQGLDTVIGDNGVTLSAGERQRVELARAILNNRPVLILDETTSNLDIANEQSIVESLQSLKSNRLIIVISHRPAISEYADVVVEINRSESSRA